MGQMIRRHILLLLGFAVGVAFCLLDAQARYNFLGFSTPKTKLLVLSNVNSSENSPSELRAYSTIVDKFNPNVIVSAGNAGDFGENWLKQFEDKRIVLFSPGNADIYSRETFNSFARKYESAYWKRQLNDSLIIGLSSVSCSSGFSSAGCFPHGPQELFLNVALKGVKANDLVRNIVVVIHHLFWIQSFWKKFGCGDSLEKSICGQLESMQFSWDKFQPDNPWFDQIHKKLAELVSLGKNVIVVGGRNSMGSSLNVDGVTYFSIGGRYQEKKSEAREIDFLTIQLGKRPSVNSRSIEGSFEGE